MDLLPERPARLLVRWTSYLKPVEGVGKVDLAFGLCHDPGELRVRLAVNRAGPPHRMHETDRSRIGADKGTRQLAGAFQPGVVYLVAGWLVQTPVEMELVFNLSSVAVHPNATACDDDGRLAQ